MKRTAWIACLALLAAMVAAPAVLAGDAEEALAAQQKSIDLFNARDYSSYFAYLHDDVEAFVGVQSPLLIKGKAGWIAFIEGIRDQSQMAQYMERNQTARVFGNTVVLNGYHDYTVHTRDGKAVTANGRTTTVMVKQGGKWLIASFHFSSYF